MRAALREQLTFKANENTSATSSMSSVPPVATMKSFVPSGRTASRRSTTSIITAVTGAGEVANVNRPIGSATGSRAIDQAFVYSIARWVVSFRLTSRKYIPEAI